MKSNFNNALKCDIIGPRNFINGGLRIICSIICIVLTFYLIPVTQNFILAALLIFVLVGLIVRLTLIFTTITKKTHELEKIDDIELYEHKIFTILIPLYKEKTTVMQNLLNAILAMNYNQDKFDVKIILEEDDKLTLNNLYKIKHIVNGDSFDKIFDVIIVPNSLPKTKPKACNFAMQFAKGEFVVIYDAEDIPHKNQLLYANAYFQKYNDIGILQCPLLFYNCNQNLLTQYFQMEYFTWFKLTLPSLAKFNMPVALGGTSNFVRKSILDKFGLWAALNVTEDAELGIRLFCNNIKTAFINIETKEECPWTLKNWINQRKRWIKGFNQTYFFYFAKFFKVKCSIFDKIIFYIIYGASGLGFVINLLIALLIFTKTKSCIEVDILEILIFISTIILAIIGWIFTLKHTQKNLFIIIIKSIFYTIFTPLYFILHSFSAVLAIIDSIYRPFYWDKTNHGQ